MDPLLIAERLKTYRHPRWWSTWLVVGLLRGLALLPIWLMVGVGYLCGAVAYLGLGRYRRIARTNIRLCFASLTGVQQERLVFRTFVSLGAGLMETAASWWKPKQVQRLQLDVQGLEVVQQALEQQGSVIVVGAHFVALEICGALLSQQMDLDVTYRQQSNHLINDLLLHYRSRTVGTAIDRDDVRTMIRRLKSGRILWLAQDQDAGRDGIYAPLFGQTASTHVSVVRLAQMAKSAVISGASYRVGFLRYRTVFEPMPEGFPGTDSQQNAAWLNQQLERSIRRFPEQYYWVHRRFKNQPGRPKAELYRR